MDLDRELDTVIGQIIRLEQEREEIFQDDKVDRQEHPRLAEIEADLPRLWDLRRRIEAARAAGLDHIPIEPSSDPAGPVE
jgi:hypothetical protein